MLLEAVYRRFTELTGGRGPIDARSTFLESLAVGQVELAEMELARAGRGFWLGNSAAITGIAPVQVLPTTAAQWVLWNPDANKTYFLRALGMYLTAGTPGIGNTLLAALIQQPSQLGASTAGTAIASKSNGNLASKMIVKSSVTITQPAAPVWVPVAETPSKIATEVAFASNVPLVNRAINGSIAIPPGQGLGLVVLGPAGTTPLYAPFAEWVEAESDME